jgi:DNA sulfur modification protein DndD
LKVELDGFKAQQLDEAKKRFEAAFQVAPESREALREQEKKRVYAANRLAQVESEIRALCEKALPFSLAGKLFDGIRRQIETERESASGEAIREHAADLAKRIVRVVEEPEPIFSETLSAERMTELERRIYRLLKEGDPAADVVKILDLSDREAARVLNRMESLENSDVFLIKPLLDEAMGLKTQIQQLEGMTRSVV